MKFTKKYKWIYLFIFLILLLFTLLFSYNKYLDYVDSKKFKEITSNKKNILMKYVIVDKDKSNPDDDIIKTTNENSKNVLFIAKGYAYLTKKGNYYETTLSNENDIVFDNISDYCFAKNNLLGEVIKDAKFSSKSRKIKVPISYFENNSDDTPVQLEIVSRITKKQFKNLKMNIKVRNKIIKQKKVTVNGNDFETSFSIADYNSYKKIRKDEITIYTNNYQHKMLNEEFDWNPTSGVITLAINPILINDVYVVINHKFYNNFLDDVDATTQSYKKMTTSATLTGQPTGIKAGETYTISGVGVYYARNTPSDISGFNASVKAAFQSADKTLYTACSDGKCNRRGSSVWNDFVFHLNIGSAPSGVDFKFDKGTYVAGYCLQDGLSVGSGGSKTASINITVVAINTTDHYVIVKIETVDPYYTQKGGGYLKFDWDETNCKLKVAKKYTGASDNLGGIKFAVYDTKAECESNLADDRIQTRTTDSDGNLTFTKLSLGEKYWIREITESTNTYFANNTAHYSDADTTARCIHKALTKSDVDENGKCLDSAGYYNTKKYYCLSVKKVDAETGQPLAGVTFQNDTTGAVGVSGADGVVTFSNLQYGTYSVTETSLDGTNGYWNDSVTTSKTFSYTTNASDEMNYDSAGNPVSCKPTTYTYTKPNHKLYYCLKVKKVDKVTGQLLKGASFSTTIAGNAVTKKDSDDGADDGVTSFFLGTNSGTYSVVEQEAPVGYAKDDRTLQANAILLPRELTYSQAQSACLKADAVDANGNNITAQSIIFKNSKYVINWYKVTENKETKANGALFKVKNVDTNEYITVSNPEAQTDDSNPTITKSCYKYTGTGTTDQNSGTAMVSMNTRTTINDVASDTNGEVCVSGLPKGNYKVEEIQPAQYHTFGSTTEATVSTSTTFKAMDDTNKFINHPTRFEFSKDIVSTYSSTDEGSYKELTTAELRKLKFNVTDVSGQIVRFKKKRDANNNVIEGEYEYLNNTIDPQGEEEVTDLQLNSERKIVLWHLPWADASNADGALYSIKEKVEDGCTDQNGNTCNGNGFYYPEYNNASDYQFRIYKTSNPVSVNKTEPKQSLSNTPTEIKFTKDDIYCKDSNCNSNYQNGTNGTTQDSVFENEEEIKVFDDIQFVLRDSTGRDVTDHLIKVSDNEYRFVKDVNTLSDELKAKLVKTDSSVVGNNLHTKDGTLKITHLCRESTYYIEEYKVPEHTVFILPTTIQFNGTVPSNWNWQGHPYVTYKVSDKESTKKTAPYSDTQVIDNTPTRILIYKKDSKYDYLIPDETTTFQLYRCKKGEECHPTDDPDNTENYERVRFWNRALIPGDKEDYKNDKTGLQTEVYKFVSTSDEKSMSESDLKSKTTYDLHPDHGVLVFRYLPANYNYVLVETVAPKNYQLPVGRNAETSFKVVDNTVQVEDKDLPNKPTSVLIKKYADDGKLLKGAEFKIYEVEDSNVCSKNLSPVNQKKKLLKLKTIRDGVYEARPEGDTDTIVTCSDRDDAKCSDIKTFVSKELTTKLTHDKYEDSWSKFEDESTSTEDGRQIELQEGVALIQYLEYDHCYVIEETKAPEGYSLPELKKRYTTITIKKNDEFAHDTNKDLINSPTPFKFYKYDEFNKLIDGAEFKLQKLDDNKKYQDVTVTEIPTENGELFYKVDKDTDNTLIRTKGGTATIYYLTAGQYRVVETKAPGNKVLSKNLNLATFFVDENGSVYGNSIIVNRSIVKTPVKNSASAELIVTIQTGQTVIRYGIVIAVLVGMISGLMILKEKKSRKDYNKDEK